MGIGSSSLLSLSGEGWAVAHVDIRTGLATNILVLFNRHHLAQQRKLSKDGRPAITAISSALLDSANQCLAFFALSVVAQSHLNQGRDSPFPAPSQYSMQWHFQLLLGNIAVARKRGIWRHSLLRIWRQLLLCYGRCLWNYGFPWIQVTQNMPTSWIIMNTLRSS